MIKLFQKQWFDISFSEFSKLNSKKLADTHFYQGFYEVFYKKYSDYNALPLTYIHQKKMVANHLCHLIIEKKAKTILSFGCGNGMIEKEIIHSLPDIQLMAYESNAHNLKWLNNIPQINTYHGEFPACFPKKQKFDLIYLSTVDYALSNKDYIALLLTIKNLTRAPIILTNLIKPYSNLSAYIKYWLKYFFATCKIYDPGQFWGYLRHFYEHQKIFQKAGYVIINKGNFANKTFWIEISPSTI